MCVSASSILLKEYCGLNNWKSGNTFNWCINHDLSHNLGFFIAFVTPTPFLHSTLETETPALESCQGDQAESEHVFGGVRL